MRQFVIVFRDPLVEGQHGVVVQGALFPSEIISDKDVAAKTLTLAVPQKIEIGSGRVRFHIKGYDIGLMERFIESYTCS